MPDCGRSLEEYSMRLSSSISVASTHRHLSGRDRGPQMRKPSPLPTVVPTRSSYLQRLLWLFGIGR